MYETFRLSSGGLKWCVFGPPCVYVCTRQRSHYKHADVHCGLYRWVEADATRLLYSGQAAADVKAHGDCCYTVAVEHRSAPFDRCQNTVWCTAMVDTNLLLTKLLCMTLSKRRGRQISQRQSAAWYAVPFTDCWLCNRVKRGIMYDNVCLYVRHTHESRLYGSKYRICFAPQTEQCL